MSATLFDALRNNVRMRARLVESVGALVIERPESLGNVAVFIKNGDEIVGYTIKIVNTNDPTVSRTFTTISEWEVVAEAIALASAEVVES
jgi:hypothetical protein